MTAIPGLEFRPIDGDDLELAVALTSALAGVEDPLMECWGIGASGAAPLGGEAFGLFSQGSLIGALWMAMTQTGVGEIKAVALPRRRWGMGLVQFMLEEISNTAKNRGSKGLFVNIAAGSEKLGETLEDSGFRGPQLADEGYPKGRWLKPLGGAKPPPMAPSPQQAN